MCDSITRTGAIIQCSRCAHALPIKCVVEGCTGELVCREGRSPTNRRNGVQGRCYACGAVRVHKCRVTAAAWRENKTVMPWVTDKAPRKGKKRDPSRRYVGDGL